MKMEKVGKRKGGPERAGCASLYWLEYKLEVNEQLESFTWPLKDDKYGDVVGIQKYWE